MTFQTDRAVLVLAHIKATGKVDEDSETGFTEIGSHGWRQQNWGQLVVDYDDLRDIVGGIAAADVRFTLGGGALVNSKCGTAGCLAGWTLFLSGVEQAWKLRDEHGSRLEYELVGSADGRDTATFAIDWLGIPIPEWAVRHDDGNLSWTPSIFAGSNSYESLVAYVADYADLPVDEVLALVDAEVERVKRRIHQAEVEDKRLIAGVNV